MLRVLRNNDYTVSSIAIIIISALLMGVNGIIAFILLFFISEQQFGRDPINKHGLAEIIVAKNRMGQIGWVKCRFQGEYSKFSDEEINIYDH